MLGFIPRGSSGRQAKIRYNYIIRTGIGNTRVKLSQVNGNVQRKLCGLAKKKAEHGITGTARVQIEAQEV